MTGRKPDSETGKLSQKVIDALLSLWVSPEDPLTFMQIHRGLVARGVVNDEKQKTATVRVLKKAQEQKLIRHENGTKEYYINVIPEEFKAFDYLQRLRSQTETSFFQVGGMFWTMCQLYLLGMPESARKYPDIKSMLHVLGVRISRLYEAFRVLAEETKKRETLPIASHSIPYDAARELLLELIPYYLGSVAGYDGDGFAFEDLSKIVPKMIEALPEEVNSQNPTCKDIILDHFKAFNELTKHEEKRGELEWQKHPSEEEQKDFALIMVPPDFMVDEDEYDRRWIRQELEEFAQKSPLYIASSLLMFKKENVDNVLEIYGRKLLGARKLNETRALYEKMHASNYVGSLIHAFEYYDDKEKMAAMKLIQDLTQKHGRKSIIVYLAFSTSGKCWFLPTLENEKLLQKFFPYHSEQEIHDWLVEGVSLYKSLTKEKEKWEHLMRTLESFKQDETRLY